MTKKIMSEKFEIILEFVKDLSSETPDVETYIYVREHISKYNLDIEISSKPLKNKMIEVDTKLSFADKNSTEKKSYFEIIYTSVVKIKEEVKDKKEMEKIILCDVQNKIYNRLEEKFTNLIKNSGFNEIKIEKKIDFEKLYKEKFN